MITGSTYLELGEPVVVVIQWRQIPKAERLDLPGLEALRSWTPRNVLILRADGMRVVRPFRGLRKLPTPPEADVPAVLPPVPGGTKPRGSG